MNECWSKGQSTTIQRELKRFLMSIQINVYWPHHVYKECNIPLLTPEETIPRTERDFVVKHSIQSSWVCKQIFINCNNCLNKRDQSLLKQQCLPTIEFHQWLPTIDCQQWRRQQIDPLLEPPLRPPICQSPHKSGRSGVPSVSRKTPVMRLDWKQVSCRRTSLSSGS